MLLPFPIIYLRSLFSLYTSPKTIYWNSLNADMRIQLSFPKPNIKRFAKMENSAILLILKKSYFS